MHVSISLLLSAALSWMELVQCGDLPLHGNELLHFNGVSRRCLAFRVLDYPQPVAAQDTFLDVVNSLGKRAIQVSA